MLYPRDVKFTILTITIMSFMTINQNYESSKISGEIEGKQDKKKHVCSLCLLVKCLTIILFAIE